MHLGSRLLHLIARAQRCPCQRLALNEWLNAESHWRVWNALSQPEMLTSHPVRHRPGNYVTAVGNCLPACSLCRRPPGLCWLVPRQHMVRCVHIDYAERFKTGMRAGRVPSLTWPLICMLRVMSHPRPAAPCGGHRLDSAIATLVNNQDLSKSRTN